MKNENGNLLTDENEVLSLWKNYFDKLLNVHENNEEIKDKIHTAELDIKEPTYLEVDAAMCLNGCSGKVQVGGKMSKPYIIHDGLKLGDGLSTDLFNLTLDIVKKLFEESKGSNT